MYNITIKPYKGKWRLYLKKKFLWFFVTVDKVDFNDGERVNMNIQTIEWIDKYKIPPVLVNVVYTRPNK